MDRKKEQDGGRQAPDPGEAAHGSPGTSASEAEPAVGSPLGLLDMSTDLRRYLVSTPLARMPTGELYREPESLDTTFDETKRNTRSEFNPANYREVLEAERQRRAEQQPSAPHPGVAPSAGEVTAPEPHGPRANVPESAPRVDQTTLVDGRNRRSPEELAALRERGEIGPDTHRRIQVARDEETRRRFSAAVAAKIEQASDAQQARRIERERRRKQAIVGVVGLLALMVLGIAKWGNTQRPATEGSVPSVTGAESELPSSPVRATDPSPLEATRPTAPEQDTPASTGANTESRHGDDSAARAPAKEPRPTRKATGSTQPAKVDVEPQQKSSEQPRSNRKVGESGSKPSALPFQAKP